MNNLSISLTFKWGKEIKGLTKNRSINGYMSVQKIRDNEIVKSAYGYAHLEDADWDDMIDFNREKDGAFSENHTNLPIPVPTYDIFSVSGHGIGGTFRLYRNDNIYNREETNDNFNSSTAAGIDISSFDKFKAGINFSFVANKTLTSNIHENNKLQQRAKYVKSSDLPNNPLYEPVYFKQMGEMTRSNAEFNNGIRGYSLLAPQTGIGYVGPDYLAQVGRFEPTGLKKPEQMIADPTANIQTSRQPRNAVMQALTAIEASKIGLTQKLEYYSGSTYEPTSGVLKADQSVNRVDEVRKGHHYSEIRVLNTDGSRYVYGLPAYNLVQEEISFAAGNNTTPAGNCATGLVSYNSTYTSTSKKSGEGNNQGKDNFVQKVVTPSYPYAFHLTAVVSPDYVDLTGNGVSDDDFGTAVKFDYQKTAENYKWRTPYTEYQAMYNEGRKTDYSDDKGSFIYGEKEIYHLHSIVGKNHIAVFYISAKYDGVGAQNIHGGSGYAGANLYKLDSVILYNKQDFYKNGSTAYKIKAAHFEYEYSLCGEVPTFAYGFSHPYKGKLTLKKVWFTYGNSFKGKFSPYQFNYNHENDPDYKYHIKAHDRWSTYKPVGSATCGSSTELTNAEFPFTPQIRGLADDYAGTWSLSEIVLPSGGKISVEYEADDYAYVQNLNAMSMLKIKGFGDSPADSSSYGNLLFTKKGKDIINNYVFIDLNGTTTLDEFSHMVYGLDSTLQFTVFADINGHNNYEYVKGYAGIDFGANDAYGLYNNGTEGYIRLKLTTLKDDDKGKDANPISKNIWNWARIHAADIVFNQNASKNVQTNKVSKGFYEMVGMFNEMANMVAGIYGNLKRRGFGQKVNVAKSFIRLNSKGQTKIGGGHRVKSIKINDNWAYVGAANANEEDFEYGQQYFYTTKEKGPDGIIREISSGVAAFEPNLGGDENPFCQPRTVREELKMVPDLMYMDDAPLGESFMPPASVGYSKVTVKSLSHQGVSRTATGKQEFEFFTAKDFPVRFQETHIDVDIFRPSQVEQLFSPSSTESTLVTASQGYKIVLNDMHGKPKAQYTYSEHSESPIGGVKYEYLTLEGNDSELSNTVKVLSASGIIQEKELAAEVEVFSDYRQSYNEVKSVNLSVNTDFFTVASFPLLIPSLYNAYKKSSQKIQTVVTTKVVSRYGILKKTIALKEGSSIVTENLLYDDITGNVLVSSVQNEFNDNVYSRTTPAHWAYDQGMGPAYKNIGVKLNSVMLNSDTIILPNGLNVRNFLVPGDEVLVTSYANGSWNICHVYEGANHRLNLIDEKGGAEFLPSNGVLYSIQVIRSGRRNLQNVPVEQMSMLHNPINGSYLSLDSIISASAVEFDDYWPFYCDKYYKYTCDTNYILPLNEISTFLNDVFDNFTVSNAGYDINTACLYDRLNGYGYKESSLDSLFSKAIVSGDEVYTLLGTSTTCVNCYDSLFIKLAENVYQGFGIADVQQCMEETQGSCVKTYGSIISTIPYNPLYESYRYILDSIAGTCTADTALNVSLQNGSSFQNNGDLVFNFARCDKNCNLSVQIPEDECYSEITQALDVKYYSNDIFSVSLVLDRGDGIIDTIETFGSADCVGLRRINCTSECLTPETSTVLNPYQMGIRGNWRMKKQLAYVDNRLYASNPDPRKDGSYSSFSPYWTYSAGPGNMIPSSSSKWIWANQVTKYTPHGNEIENQDALGRYSSALFGFNYTLPIAVAGNSKYEQIAFESFEENSEFWFIANCYDKHFTFDGFMPTQAEYSKEFAHSGKYSLHLKPSQTVSSANDRTFCSDASTPFGATETEWRSCYCVGRFNPDTGRYILSSWLKEGVNMMDTSYLNSSIQVKLHKIGSVTETYTFKGQGQIIDGWQRVYGEFRISDSVEQVEITLVGADVDTWFDDLRVHPFNSNMKSYAYDQITLRLLAELDENNYATYYEYDQEGALIRVKKETERGVQTLKEVRKSILKIENYNAP